ncbi:ACD_00300 [African swine fever virus]
MIIFLLIYHDSFVLLILSSLRKH